MLNPGQMFNREIPNGQQHECSQDWQLQCSTLKKYCVGSTANFHTCTIFNYEFILSSSKSFLDIYISQHCATRYHSLITDVSAQIINLVNECVSFHQLSIQDSWYFMCIYHPEIHRSGFKEMQRNHIIKALPNHKVVAQKYFILY